MISARAALIMNIAATIALINCALTYLATVSGPLAIIAGGATFAAAVKFLNEFIS